MSQLFDNIKTIAREKGISISKLERDAGLSRGHIYKWEDASPTVDNLQSVADVLKVPIGKLLKEKK